jgi:hypothetical protein
VSITLSRCFCALIFLVSTCGYAQQVRTPLITRPIDDNTVVTLKGNTHPMARAMFDIGVAPPNLSMDRMLLVLKRDPQQDLAVRRLLDEQQDKNSPNYHQWLTPTQFGAQFGPTDQDIQLIAGWLQNHGFQVNRVSSGRSTIEFSGFESQVEQAFHTQIHRYALPNGEQHWANASDPEIPLALAPAVEGVVTLNNFPRKPMLESFGKYNSRTKQLTPANPLFTFPGGCDQLGNCYAVGPADFGTIYNVQSLWNAGTDGTGQKIAIVGRTDINIQDTRDFRNLFGLPANDPVITYDGQKPPVLPDESESNIDIQWAGAIAPKATINLVISASTETADGVDLSAIYIVDNNLAPVMSVSYGLCELGLGTAGNQFYNTLWQQAAAQGITVVVASGDNGAAGCDFFNGNYPDPAQFGLAVSGFASTPYNVAIGGTDFNDPFNPLTYWNMSNTSATLESAKGYIPEVPWNDSCDNPVLSQAGWSANAETNCNDSRLSSLVWTVGGSGGLSNCTVNSQSLGTCSGGYTKPSWQVGAFNDGKRDLPDVSFFASNGFMGNFYIYCQADAYGPCNTLTFGAAGGTSFGAPIFAGVMALVNQQMQTPEGQGNPNYILYKLAGQTGATCPSSTSPGSSCIFHDVTSGTIAMPCLKGSPNCTVQTSGHTFGVLSGYSAGAGYDFATGLGSVNVANLLSKWNTVSFRPTNTTLGLSPTSNLSHGQSVTVSGSVAPSSGSGTPTGGVSLLTSTGLKVDGFSLTAGGSLSGNTSMLPGGSYSVTAHYAGDTTFGGSDSAPVSVTVGKENSSEQLQLETFDWQGNPISASATSAVYGSPYFLRVNVLNSAGLACEGSNGLPLFGCPTGSVTLTDNGSPAGASTDPLNTMGYTEDFTVQFPGGANSVRAQYAGDSSYNASSTTTALNITPAPTNTTAVNICCTTVGQPLIANVQVQAQSSGAAPAGTVSFLLNGSPASGTVTYIPTPAGGTPPTTALNAFISSGSSSSFPTPGTYTLAANYSGDANYQASNSPIATFFVGFATPTMNLQSSPNPVNAGSSTTLIATVGGESPTIAPTGTISFYGGYAGTPPGTVLYSTGKNPSTGNLDLQGTLAITPGFTAIYSANYSGDVNYPSAQVCCSAVVTVNGSDFVFTAPQNSATVGAGYAGYYQLFLGFQSSTGPVSLTCSGLPSESTCNVSPNPVSSTGPVYLQISTTAPNGASRTTSSAHNSPYVWLSSLLPFTAILFIRYRRGGTKRSLARLGLIFLLFLGIACGGGGYGGGGGGNGGGGGGGGGTPPLAPTSLTATPISSSKVNLGWFPSVGATSYNVYRSTANGFAPSSANKIANTNQSSFYPDTGLTPSTTYYYVLEAINGAGSSGPSNQASVSTQAFDAGTPAGTYNITVTGTSGAMSHSVNLTLVVQ